MEPNKVLEQMAEQTATSSMRAQGRLQPTLLLLNAEGCTQFTHAGLSGESSKDHLAQVARLLAVAHCATGVSMVLEAWARVAKAPGGPLNERIEVVTVITETVLGTTTQLLEIRRNNQGKFKRLRPYDLQEADSVGGRFAGILPPFKPTPDQVREARLCLNLLGVSPDGKTLSRTHN
jgi:hypothetical protein